MIDQQIIMMSVDEARRCVNEIKAHISQARMILLDLYEREGWKSLGYFTWRECVSSEFGQNQSTLYFQLQAAQVERNISNTLENDKVIPMRQLRPLASLAPDQQREAWAIVRQTAPDGKVTASHVERVVREYIEPEKAMPHVAHNSGNNEWYTPAEYIKAAYEVLGEIDLDPASSEIANQNVKAKKFYSIEDDGLQHTWRGRIWMNPPYASDLIGKFTEKFAQHVQSGDISGGIVLVNNATDTEWFYMLISVASGIVFTRGRVRFLRETGEIGAPLQGQAIIYSGNDPKHFYKAFSRFGWRPPNGA